MSLFVHALNTNYTSESGLGQLTGRILSEGVLGLTDLKVSEKGTGQNRSVDVAPGALVLHNPAGHGHTLYSTAIENVLLAAADPLNPRKSLIVAVLDVDYTNNLVNDAEGGWSIIEVPGAAASSPLEPDSSAIQSVAGAGNLYEVIALVDVPAGTSQITDDEITDRRPQAGLIPDLVPLVPTGKIPPITNDKLSTEPGELGGEWLDWIPALRGSGSMSISAVNIQDARYKQIGKTVLMTIAAQFTVGGSLGNGIAFSLPVLAKATPNSPFMITGYVNRGSGNEGGYGWVNGENEGMVMGYNNTNFTAGTLRTIRVQVAYEAT